MIPIKKFSILKTVTRYNTTHLLTEKIYISLAATLERSTCRMCYLELKRGTVGTLNGLHFRTQGSLRAVGGGATHPSGEGGGDDNAGGKTARREP